MMTLEFIEFYSKKLNQFETFIIILFYLYFILK